MRTGAQKAMPEALLNARIHVERPTLPIPPTNPQLPSATRLTILLLSSAFIKWPESAEESITSTKGCYRPWDQ